MCEVRMYHINPGETKSIRLGSGNSIKITVAPAKEIRRQKTEATLDGISNWVSEKFRQFRGRIALIAAEAAFTIGVFVLICQLISAKMAAVRGEDAIGSEYFIAVGVVLLMLKGWGYLNDRLEDDGFIN